MTTKILIVDDEVGMQIALREVLQRQKYDVTVAKDALEALERLEAETFDLVLTDVRMPEMSGLELLARARLRWPQTPILVMTAYGTIEDAVEAMKNGASDYLLKPFSSETVEQVIAEQLRRVRTASHPEDADETAPDAKIAGSHAEPIASSQAMRDVLALAREIANSTATILIQGESGTGKEVLARYIHRHSGRQGRSFVALNCAALPEGLLESELFGHEKGSFTGAVLARKGKFELANHGTLLLDEVSEMALPLQAKLLRAIQEREIDPIGSQHPISLNVRIIATTNRDLGAYISEGNFREDLYYRLQVIAIEIPPLRDRREDILPLSEYFVRRLCRENHRPRKKLSQSMCQHLIEQPWRGNVRELENYLERAVLLCKSDVISPENIFLPNALSPRPFGAMPPRRATDAVIPIADRAIPSPIPSSFGQTDRPAPPLVGNEFSMKSNPIVADDELITLEELERRMIIKTLDRVNGNRTRAADLLGVSVRTIRNKINLYGLGAGAEMENSARRQASAVAESK